MIWSAAYSGRVTDGMNTAFLQEDIFHLEILRDVSIESVWGLLEHCPLILLKPGDALLRKGQLNHKMYIVIDGRLSVHLETPTSDPFAFIEQGQTVGELSVIDECPASAYVLANVSSRLLAIDETTFWRLVAASHAVAANILQLLARRLRQNNVRILEGESQCRILERQAVFDALTGLHNRRWLDQNLVRLVSRHQLPGRPFSVLMLDVDHFKRFNDDYGHDAGDRVLSMVGSVLSTHLRPTDLASRYGGEEFCIMLPETAIDGGITAANRIRKAILAQEVCCADGSLLPSITVSIGIACLLDCEDASSVLARADAALYRAKANGRNRVEQ